MKLRISGNRSRRLGMLVIFNILVSQAKCRPLLKIGTYISLNYFHVFNLDSMSLKCSGLYLAQFRQISPNLLASGDGKKNAMIVGDVYIHPSAKVHPAAKVANRYPCHNTVLVALLHACDTFS